MKNPSVFFEKSLALYLQEVGALEAADRNAIKANSKTIVPQWKRESLIAAFSWMDTPEGYSYWWKMHNNRNY